MGKTINQVFEMDISKQLQAYEVEYHVLQEELINFSPLSDNQRMDKLEETKSSLCKQNFDLLEQLQEANGRIQSQSHSWEDSDQQKQAEAGRPCLRAGEVSPAADGEEFQKQTVELDGPQPDLTQPKPMGYWQAQGTALPQGMALDETLHHYADTVQALNKKNKKWWREKLKCEACFSERKLACQQAYSSELKLAMQGAHISQGFCCCLGFSLSLLQF